MVPLFVPLADGENEPRTSGTEVLSIVTLLLTSRAGAGGVNDDGVERERAVSPAADCDLVGVDVPLLE